MSRYTKYYTSADTFVFIESPQGSNSPVLIDKAEFITFSEGVSAQPIYGIGQPQFQFTSLGNALVQGILSVRFVHPRYLEAAVLHTSPQVTELENSDNLIEDFERFRNQTTDEINLASARSVYSRAIASSRIFQIPQNFNIRLVFDNGNAYYSDERKGILITGVRFIGSQLVSSDSGKPISEQFSFIARGTQNI